MKTEQILRAKYHGLSNWQWEELKDQFPYSEMPSAMQTCSIAFGEWLRINEWAFAIFDSEGDWVKINEKNELEFKTTDELFEEFNKSI